MTAAKLVGALSRIPNYDGENADAFKAYTQAFLSDFEGDTETWVELPRDRWPDVWFKDGAKRMDPIYTRPVSSSAEPLRPSSGRALAATALSRQNHRRWF